jgi:hypothetical protein
MNDPLRGFSNVRNAAKSSRHKNDRLRDKPKSPPLIGYMRVSKADGLQVLDLQRDALREAGVLERERTLRLRVKQVADRAKTQWDVRYGRAESEISRFFLLCAPTGREIRVALDAPRSFRTVWVDLRS